MTNNAAWPSNGCNIQIIWCKKTSWNAKWYQTRKITQWYFGNSDNKILHNKTNTKSQIMNNNWKHYPPASVNTSAEDVSSEPTHKTWNYPAVDNANRWVMIVAWDLQISAKSEDCGHDFVQNTHGVVGCLFLAHANCNASCPTPIPCKNHKTQPKTPSVFSTKTAAAIYRFCRNFANPKQPPWPTNWHRQT